MKNKRGYYDVFLQTCSKYPSRVAVREYSNGMYKSYTYSELYGVCEYISQNIQNLCTHKGPIGIMTERNAIIPSVIAAAHKYSKTFMFLDPTHTKSQTLEGVKFTFMLVIRDVSDKRIAPDIMKRKADKIIPVFDSLIYFFVLNGSDNSNPSMNHLPNEYSFIITTSGTTGDAKKVYVPTRCIKPNIADLTKIFEITCNDVIYFSTPLTFDPSMVEILLACENGACLLIAPEDVDVLFPRNTKYAVTVWQTTPSRFLQYSNCDISKKILCDGSPLKILALGGEPINGISRLKELKSEKNQTKVYALYGVTEMSCWACITEIDLDKMQTEKELPLGKCLSQTKIKIRKHKNSSVGQILLESKTRQCTILNRTKTASKAVETGDLGQMKKGIIYYMGRSDDVVKRFGNKINLQQIEATVMTCPQIKTCSCVWLAKPMQLVIYYSSDTIRTKELANFLKCKLNDKLWPDHIIRVDDIPVTAHGKICKTSLLNKLHLRYPSSTDFSPKSLFIQEVNKITASKAAFDDIKYKDFFSIGGTSFLAASLCNRIAMVYPEMSAIILPHLMSQKKTLGEILQIAESELDKPNKKFKKRVRRVSSDFYLDSESTTVHGSKRKLNPESEFLVFWKYDTKMCVDATPTLFVHVFTLYVVVGSHSGRVVVFNGTSGEKLGLLKLTSRVEASVYCFYFDGMPCPRGVVGTYDGTVVCFELDKCTEVWRVNIGSTIKSKGTFSRGRLYMAAYSGHVYCMDIANGNVKNTIEISDHPISADLVLAKEEFIIVGTLSGVIASIHAVNNTVAWRINVSSPIFGSPVLYDRDKYVVYAEVNGAVHCRTVEKGFKIWKYQGTRGNIFSSLYVKNENKMCKILFGCHDSTVYCLNVKNFQPSLYWKTQMPSPVYSTPCGFNESYLLAVASNGTMCTIDWDTGCIVSEKTFPDQVFSSPAIHGDYLFIGCRDDHLYALRYIS